MASSNENASTHCSGGRAWPPAGVAKSEIVVMLGANGASKLSFLRAIAGLTPAEPGAALTKYGRNLTVRPQDEIVQAGIALVPGGHAVFAELSVQKNLILGAYPRRARSQTGAGDRRPRLFDG
jgi:branched-chain amino acid transport system ATP-binding protein